LQPEFSFRHSDIPFTPLQKETQRNLTEIVEESSAGLGELIGNSELLRVFVASLAEARGISQSRLLQEEERIGADGPSA
jgi:hypothetical protein